MRNYQEHNAKDIRDLTIYTKTIPAHPASFADFPSVLHPDIRTYLTSHNIPRLYTHQAEMFEKAQSGENVVITTSTASGKTLSFLLPVLQAVLDNPLTRAIFVYPTKALAADQYRALQPILDYFGAGRISAGVYDGDTMQAERSRIRKSANIILTNPEMLNAAFLPNHSKYGFDFIFTNLKYVVIDELHSYRGAFGAHLANIFRRMKRVCGYYRSKLQFLCSSATIANPVELAGRICGEEFVLINRDGSAAPEKEYRIIQPPEIKGSNDKIFGRRSASTVAADLIPELVEEDRHFIAFGRSRRNVEVILKESRDKLDAAGFLSHGDSGKIAGYRGGYTPLERREIERKMTEGELSGLVSTNALELGIDIGSLDSTVIVGYPGTRASFWQQSGRAGRGSGSKEAKKCINYLILENQPFDQYIAIDPEWLFSQESENAIVDPDNLLIELAHIRAAAAEMPLSLDDAALFPDLGEVIPVLMSADEVKSLAGRFAWAGPAFPAGDYSLRNMDKTRFKLIVKDDVEFVGGRRQAKGPGREVTEMDESQAYHELHPGAVYMHEGVLYEVLKLDLVSRTAEAVPFDGNYYTVPSGTEETRILQTFQEEDMGRTRIHFGDINVNEVISMYKKLQFHNHQNLGYVDLTQPLQKSYDTESTWIDIPKSVAEIYRSLLVPNRMGELVLNDHFEGLCYAVKNAAMMTTMTERDDIDAVVSNNAVIPDGRREEQVVSLYIYDKYEGGLGYSEKIYELVPQIIDNAIRMVEGCSCESGCPACVGDYNLDKKMVLWGLKNLLKESEPPEFEGKQVEESRPFIQKGFSFYRLPLEWDAFCDSVVQNGESGGAFLRTVEQVEVNGHRLILTVGSSFYEEWLMDPDNMRGLENTVRYHAVCPSDMRIEVQVLENRERADKIKGKLRRRYEDRLS
ncbi:DEAD/DEAH box helicase [Mediterraneibacter glycyrrhizinilyticus]|nr:DEAD/DEAH box helicase [Mediterraneibacter glycyrrhizinilyticus]MBM6802760.1 DEAD/DEAH box helicase [Mediterraneibacter glycyrrhizinilyticus]